MYGKRVLCHFIRVVAVLTSQYPTYVFFLGLGRLSQAEEYLAQAQWTVLKTPECPDSIKSKLFRNLGLLYAAQGNYPDALSQLADDVSLTDSLTSHQISIRMD